MIDKFIQALSTLTLISEGLVCIVCYIIRNFWPQGKDLWDFKAFPLPHINPLDLVIKKKKVKVLKFLSVFSFICENHDLHFSNIISTSIKYFKCLKKISVLLGSLLNNVQINESLILDKSLHQQPSSLNFFACIVYTGTLLQEILQGKN